MSDVASPLTLPLPLRRTVALVLLRTPRASLLAQLRRTLKAVMNSFRSFVLSKGFAAGVALYLMRYDSVVLLYKQALIVGTSAVFLWLNFHLDIEDDPSPKGLTIGISRLVLLAVCFYLWRRSPYGLGPLLCGFATQLVPRLMFLLFKVLYIAARTVLRWTRRDRPSLPPSTATKDGLEHDSCCICMEAECDYRTPCAHAFHAQCLRRWAATSPRCPLCNRHIAYRPSLAQRLRSFFVLDYDEWAHYHKLCGSWWNEPVFD